MQGPGVAIDRIVGEAKREFSKFKSGEDELSRSSKSSRKLVWISSRRGDEDDEDDEGDGPESGAASTTQTQEQPQSGGSSEQSGGSRSYSFKMGVSQRRVRGNWVKPPQEQNVKETVLNNKGEPCPVLNTKGETRPAHASQSGLDAELFHAVEIGDSALVKLLHDDGASLESVNSEGMTPLMLACTDNKLFDTALTLLALGANVKAYRRGAHGGYPLHHAAVGGLTGTVALLLSYSADALLPNDDGQTPLDIARERRHVEVVRIIEDWICFFGGFLREIHSDGIGKKITYKKIWAVVLPTSSTPNSPSARNELALYASKKVAKPYAVVLLGSFTSDIQPDFNSRNQELIVTDKVTKSTFRFRAEIKGDSEQLKRLYTACMQGQRQDQAAVPEEQELQPESTDEVELAKAIDASIETAVREGVPFSEMVELHLQAKKQLYKQPVAAAATRVAAFPSRPRPPPLPVQGATAVAAAAATAAVARTARATAATATAAAEGPQCIICMDAPALATCIPCGHGGCFDCLSQLDLCPICRMLVVNVVKAKI